MIPSFQHSQSYLSLLPFVCMLTLPIHSVGLVKRGLGYSESSVTMTYYGVTITGELYAAPSKSTPGACGLDMLPKNPNLFVALNKHAYESQNACGMCAMITYKGACTVAPIVDMCPGCGMGPNGNGKSSGLDVSLQVFSNLVGGKENALFMGVAKVDYKIVTCPSSVAATGSTQIANSDPCNGRSSSLGVLTTSKKLATSKPTKTKKTKKAKKTKSKSKSTPTHK